LDVGAGREDNPLRKTIAQNDRTGDNGGARLEAVVSDINRGILEKSEALDMFRNHLVVVVAIFSCLSMASLLPAAPPKAMNNTANKKNAANAKQGQQQQTAIDAAQQALDDAQAALDAVALKAKTQFEASSDYTAAAAEVSADQNTYDAASANVLQRLDADPTYSAAKSQNETAKTELTALQSNGSDDEISAKSTEVMETASAVHKLESAALAIDPTATAAQAKLVASQAALTALESDFHTKLIQTPDYVSAKAAVDAADKRLVEAEGGHTARAGGTATVRGKITNVGSDSLTMTVTGAKKATHTYTVNYTTSTTITGAANGTLDKSAVGKSASVTGVEDGTTITASAITINAAAKKKPATT
jgi:hypothetical protein